MSQRTDRMKARRAERQRREEEARRAEARQRLVRRAGYVAIAALATALISLAAVLGGQGRGPAGNDEGPAPGAKAPDFSLADVISGERVTAASLRGQKTLLFFSEGVSCQACMIQVADLERAGAMKEAGIRLVSVTTDAPELLADAAMQYGIRTPLLADPNTEMSAAYGMLGHGGMGHPTQDGHAFMLIDRAGTVRWHRAYLEMYVEPDRLLADMRAGA